MNVVIILQARMSSERLPGKVLLPAGGKPLLQHELESLQKVASAQQVVIATTTDSADHAIVDFAKDNRFEVFTGSPLDVLDRFYQAAQHYNADVVVRVGGDCPLIDPAVVHQVIQRYLERKDEADYVSNVIQRSYPRGLDVEVFSFSTLEKAHQLAKAPREREHVTLYLYEHPHLFRLENVKQSEDLSDHRWTVDEPEDYELVQRILSELTSKELEISMENVLKVLEDHPDWISINRDVQQKKA